MKHSILIVAVAALALGCEQAETPSEPGSDNAAFAAGGNGQNEASLPTHAEIEFGGHQGTSFPPASHDRSFHAFDKIRPHTVVIAAGGSVTIEIDELHQPAIYEPGTTPEDIDVNDNEPIPVLPALRRITDTDGRIALGPNQSLTEEQEWESPPGTFATPGKYLIICTTMVHFVEAKMYAWVIVK